MDLQLGLFGDEATTTAARVAPCAPTPAHRRLGERLSPRLRLGTSSWSFPGWAGIVYGGVHSESVLARAGLEAYAAHPLLRTVSVDRTFYRPMAPEDLSAYVEVVPGHFRFLVKSDRLVTSPTDPEPRGIRGPNPRFLDVAYARDEVVGPFVDGLGERGGALVFQFPPIPPNLVGGRGPFVERLHGFLTALPQGPTYAVELRTPAFLTAEYVAALEDAGAAHCYTVHPAMAPLERQLEILQPYEQPALVIRWMLRAGLRYEAAKDRYAPFDRMVDPDVATRDLIANAALDALIAERDVFVVANNKAEGSAPLSVFRLAERIAGWDEGAEEGDDGAA